MTASTPPFRRLALVGLGLIGGSIARAARRAGLVGRIAGHDASADVRATVEALGFCDEVHEVAAGAVHGADLVILCTPVGAFGDVARSIAPALAPGAILSDVGSTKGSVVAAVAPHVPPGVHFIPAHPVAGTEHSGPAAGFAGLFEGRWCLLTPPDGADPAQVERLAAFWRALGCQVDVMDVTRHDRVLAVTSHLPHLIAYTIVGTAADLETVTRAEAIRYSAGGFRDMTRIAASDPVMWRDVFLNNREAVLEVLGRFSEELLLLQRAVRWGDGETLERVFSRGREIRRGVIEAGQDTAGLRGPAPQ
ncbi:MAG: prephenate/arogenate dehydrogenase family protein [Gemmatimonadales bacterium]|nr:prephenate/arogenate dehydrogenase family protein [Gemmatimonadales bacterium]